MTFKGSLIEFLKLFYPYDERIELKQILKTSEILKFYKNSQPNPQLDLLIEELLNYLKKKVSIIRKRFIIQFLSV